MSCLTLVKLLPNIKFHKNHPVGAELFHADGWMYRRRGQHDEPNAFFLQLFRKFAKGVFFSRSTSPDPISRTYSLQFVKGHALL